MVINMTTHPSYDDMPLAQREVISRAHFTLNQRTSESVLTEMLPAIEARWHDVAREAAQEWMFAGTIHGVTQLVSAEKVRATIRHRVAEARSDAVASENMAGFDHDEW